MARVTKTEAGCWLVPAVHDDGYGHIVNDDGKTIGSHRASWIVHRGPIPPGMVVCHRCDVPNCVNPEHLFVGTQRDNMRDCYAKGRMTPPTLLPNPPCTMGAKNGNAKLSEAAVSQIRERRGTVSAAVLAREFGVSKQTVYFIWQGRTWRHLPRAA